MWRRAFVIGLGLVSTACAAASSPSRPVRIASRDVITAAEIVASRVTDVYQAVLQLRPEYFRRRAAVPAMPSYRGPEVVVYLDDTLFGDVESMRHIPLQRVRLIRYLSPVDASLRWRGDHSAGVIHVITRSTGW